MCAVLFTDVMHSNETTGEHLNSSRTVRKPREDFFDSDHWYCQYCNIAVKHEQYIVLELVKLSRHCSNYLCYYTVELLLLSCRLLLSAVCRLPVKPIFSETVKQINANIVERHLSTVSPGFCFVVFFFQNLRSFSIFTSFFFWKYITDFLPKIMSTPRGVSTKVVQRIVNI